MRKLLILMLIPAALFGQALKVETPEKFIQPAGTIDRVSKRTANTKTFQDSAHYNAGKFNEGSFVTIIGEGALHYKDSTGAWREYAFTETDLADTKSGLNKQVDAGRFKVSYGTGKYANLRYEGLAGYIEFTPAFDTTQVKAKFEISETRVKAIYTLANVKAPHRLAWGVKATAPLSKIPPPIAWTDKGDSVGVEAMLKSDSLIYTIFRDEGFKGAIYVDPTVYDTSLAGSGITNDYSSRDDAVAANGTYVWADGVTIKADDVDNQWRRGFVMFDLTDQSALATVVDSARVYIFADSTYGDSVVLHAAYGTFTGGAISTAWHNDFQGWAASGPYSFTGYFESPLRITDNGAGAYQSVLLNAAARDTVLAHMGTDTLRMVLILTQDKMNYTSFREEFNAGSTQRPYLVIHYQLGHPPGLTTTDADTLRYVEHEFYGVIDSTGGVNLTVRGFQYILNLLWTDTAAVTDTGSFGTGAFSHVSGPLTPDSLYLVRAFGINPGGTSYGAWDTVSTTVSGGSGIRVDGRLVNRAR